MGSYTIRQRRLVREPARLNSVRRPRSFVGQCFSLGSETSRYAPSELKLEPIDYSFSVNWVRITAQPVEKGSGTG